VVPDDQAWTLWGADPYAAALRPVGDAGAARHVLLPDRLPRPLGPALSRLREDLPAGRRVEVRAAPALEGERIERVLAGVDAKAQDGGEGEDRSGEDGHDHGDMMAITGAPGSDGLVMEPIDTTLGPLGGPLPGGLRVAVRLAGDVVEHCDVAALLQAGAAAPDRPPDPLAASAWEAALRTALAPDGGERGWETVAGVEVERAVSHVAWLRAFGRLLAWEPLVEACSAALTPLLAVRPSPADDTSVTGGLECALEGLALLRRLVRGRRMAARTRGRAVVGGEVVAREGLTGPVARAAGVPADARVDDPAYASLAFRPVVEQDGDAHARTVVRHAEAVAALEIAVAALARTGSAGAPAPFADGAGGALVEGPRGPLRARRGEDGTPRCTAAGSEALLGVAAHSTLGREWGAALVCLASFDLSPWRVGG